MCGFFAAIACIGGMFTIVGIVSDHILPRCRWFEDIIDKLDREDYGD